jgi:hypothetical protein
MSQQLISHNADLKRLRDEGFDVGIVSHHLVVRHVPYVNSKREVRLGVLVSTISLSGERTNRPDTHVAMFCGEHPSKADGTKLDAIAHSSDRKDLGAGLTIDHSFSSKPASGYEDYYHKMATYCAIISGPARTIDASATARPHLPVDMKDEDSVFAYLDTASSRAGIGAVTERLRVPKVAIVGLGGTGAYVLDLVAKTPVGEIHLFDGDHLLSHNAFRAPGAASIEDLSRRPRKVDYYRDVYSRFRRGIVPHNCYVDGSNLQFLDGMHSVFLCIDGSEAKRQIVTYLEAAGIVIIDAGIGIEHQDGSLSGIVRVTTSTPSQRCHVHEKKRISFADAGDNPYDANIQIADLNALNACLAVVKWKKLLGFYKDLEQEHHCLYTIDGNHMINEDLPCRNSQN